MERGDEGDGSVAEWDNEKIQRERSKDGHLSAYATLNWAWKTALSLANDGSAYAAHVPNNAASGARHCSVEIPAAQPKTRFLIASLWIRRHRPTRALVLRQRLCLKLANVTRALKFRAFTLSVTLQSELMQLPRYVKRSTTSSASPWIVNRLVFQLSLS
ncbi:hypothetical protein CSKR_103686 [Clonorchis sinensis]|uniref:Uncharacterized protein n=1 Tax=Clonorchis sinensis TaxID=79923 RepID=A0A3R7C3U5_CLOSI|nr:hypothetical protein CSKR_103686 [Clonorchis sinensis]